MATKISLKNLPVGFQTLISNGKHAILGDEPVASKGTDLGFSPEDLILSGLGACKVSTVRFIARKNGWEIGNVEAELEMKFERKDGSLHTHVSVKIDIEGDLTEEQRQELLRQADRCYIHRIIEGEWSIGSALEASNDSNNLAKSV
ncbi:OsmC family protein [Haliscomenobacter sp.]|uniref:OsmC family protein n=1 Tax=Haliscomenobacter sp. TaxID=2717303 RepID=UPI0033652DC2